MLELAELRAEDRGAGTEEGVMTDQAGRVANEESPRRRVVVGVDGSAGARAALLFALEEAALRGVPAEAVTAYHAPEAWMDFKALSENESDVARKRAEQRAEAFIAKVLPEGPQPPPEVRVKAAWGTAADVLIRESAGADLLVVGSRGHGGFTSMLLGSVSMQCAVHAACPVAVVHSPEAHRERMHLWRRRHGKETHVRDRDSRQGSAPFLGGA
jgi:nucleotide-binding universal stress UspA family protein